MIMVLLTAAGVLAVAVLVCVIVDPPVPIGGAAAALVGVPSSSLDPEERRT
jgi:hypothetical protein